MGKKRVIQSTGLREEQAGSADSDSCVADKQPRTEMRASKWLMMIGLPNSGTTWLANIVKNHSPQHSYYDMEFFNPLRNEKHEARLMKHFGCELAGCYDNIAEGERPGIHDVIRETWGAEPYTFTKEVFSPLKLPVFAQHFRCFVFHREAAGVFPPKRLRIWSFYEHAWFAIRRQGHVIEGSTVRERAVASHAWMSQQLLLDARRLRVPVLRYTDLYLDRDAVASCLTAALGYCTDGMLDEIEATREPRPREFARAELAAAA